MNCKVCDRNAYDGDFCPSHLKAYKNIVLEYNVWREALRISWKDYLREIEKNSVTGEWAKEVAQYLIKKEETKDVKKS